MAAFVLWGRVQQTAESEFVAIATAVCADGSAKGIEVVPQFKTSRQSAENSLRAAMLALGGRVRAKGHIVIDVETDGV